KITEDNATERAGILSLVAELHEHLALMVRQFEEETSQGDGIAEEHFDGYVGAKSVLERTEVDSPQWENALIVMHELREKASEVPGLTATLDELRSKLAEAREVVRPFAGKS